MTYDVSLLNVFQTGRLFLDHIAENDFTASDILSVSHVSRGFNQIITNPEVAARLWKRYTLASPFQFVPTTIIIQRGAACDVSDNQLVPIEQRHVMREQDILHSFDSAIVGKEVLNWFYFLTHGTFGRSELTLNIDESYHYFQFAQKLSGNGDISVQLRTLINYMSFDTLKSFIILCISGNQLDQANWWAGCVNWLREVACFPAVQKDPVGCLYFYHKIRSNFASYGALSDEEAAFKNLRDELIQLPGFSFDIFTKVCLQNDHGHTGQLDIIKYLSNFVKLYKAGHINFQAWGAQIERDNSLELHLSSMTDAFVRAVERGYVSCHLGEVENLFGLFPLLKEETELDRRLNRIFEGLCERLKGCPDGGSDFKSWIRLLNALFESLFMNTSQYNLERNLEEDRAPPLFSKLWMTDEITTEKLYNHLVMIQSARKKIFDSFVFESGVLRNNPHLRDLFLQEPMLFEFFIDRCDDGVDAVFEGNSETISSLAELVESEKKLIEQIRQVFSTETLEVLSGLTGAEISKLLNYFKNRDGDPAQIKGFFDFFLKYMNQVIEVKSFQESQVIMATLTDGFTRLKSLLDDKYFPIYLDSFGCAVQLFFMGSNSPDINALSDRFSKIESSQFKQHVLFLRESTLHLLCKSFGSRAATFYFEELSKGDNFIFAKILFMMSLGALTQEQWIESLKTFIRSNYYRERLKHDNGTISWNSASFTSLMDDYIDKILEAFLNGIEIDREAVLAKVLLLENGSEDESDEGDVSSEDSESESE